MKEYKMKMIFLVIFFFGLFGLAKSTQASTIHYVTPAGGPSIHDGASWATAYSSNDAFCIISPQANVGRGQT